MQPLASVAVIVKIQVPAVVGVPERVVPEGGLGVSAKAGAPGGNVPFVTANVYGVAPPVAEIATV